MKSEGFTSIHTHTHTFIYIYIQVAHINNKCNTSWHKTGMQHFDFHSEYIYALCWSHILCTKVCQRSVKATCETYFDFELIQKPEHWMNEHKFKHFLALELFSQNHLWLLTEQNNMSVNQNNTLFFSRILVWRKTDGKKRRSEKQRQWEGKWATSTVSRATSLNKLESLQHNNSVNADVAFSHWHGMIFAEWWMRYMS